MLVTCAIIIENGLILCAKRGQRMSLPGKWEFPGGKVEPGETPEECLLRELEEELGIGARIVAKLPDSPFKYESGLELVLIPMICSIEKGTPIPREHSELKWLNKEKLTGLDWAEADLPIVQAIVNGSYI